MPEASREDAADQETLRDALARGNVALARIGPILSHLLAAPDHSLFSDEIVARIRGMCQHLAWQVLRAQAEAAGQAGREAFAERHGEALAEHLLSGPALLAHCHALALEWQLTEKLEIQYGIDPVLSPLIQELIAAEDDGLASAAMASLTAQARFSQTQRRMELPLGELPGDLFHDLLMDWRAFGGHLRSDAMIRAEAKLRNAYDEGAGRIALLSRVVGGMGNDVQRALDIDQAGAPLFLTAMAARTGQSRVAAVLSTNQEQTARLALGLRAAGLDSSEVERQVLRLDPKALPPREIAGMPPEDARRLLAEAAIAGGA
ncbi:hypothetical protein [Qipengyuania qiaonensis]|uniref:DUF2336 domain-containing protein n=1 Tax=Qipengyuania qiaonensis TaxID=2867240 RepID=A0ABS7J5C5_9SPHN|nr:hypothetical protein [Qipengyuania qiaonensis]MBX7481200.1 hypothetical protein [Qipengyuania qiaonensis]